MKFDKMPSDWLGTRDWRSNTSVGKGSSEKSNGSRRFLLKEATLLDWYTSSKESSPFLVEILHGSRFLHATFLSDAAEV